MTSSGASLVLGVAIAIPQPHATIVTSWRRRLGDPAADLILPHVTLLPPTRVPADRLDQIHEHLAKVAGAAEPFTMHLAGTGTFRPTSPVVYLQIATGVSQCELLESAVRGGPLDRDLDFPYHPHVTVAQDLDEESLDDAYEGLSGFVARFGVDAFGLFTRERDGAWRPHSHFPLGAGTSLG